LEEKRHFGTQLGRLARHDPVAHSAPREGETVGVGTFLKLGVLVMPPALLLAIGAARVLG